MQSYLKPKDQLTASMTAEELQQYYSAIEQANQLITRQTELQEKLDRKPQTLKQIAERQNCSVEWIRVTEKKAILKCKRAWIQKHNS